MSTIKVAVIGCGNCFSSLLQGLQYYTNYPERPGLIHREIGGYRVSDIRIVAAFDINAKKVGKDISEAIWVKPNNSQRFANVPKKGVLVSPGFLGDGISEKFRRAEPFPIRNVPMPEVVRVLKQSGAEMVVSFLPTGSKIASRAYARACIEAGAAFINGIPEFICSDPKWAERFRRAGLPCAGDDWMSGVGATSVNRVLLGHFVERGEILDRRRGSTQLNYGNNMDFLNLMDKTRIRSKKISKQAPLIFDAHSKRVVAQPAGYDRSLRNDEKVAIIKIVTIGFGGRKKRIELKLSVEDSPNAAVVAVDAIRLMKLSLDRGLAGYQEWSAWDFKHPLRQLPLSEGKALVEDFIAGKSPSVVPSLSPELAV